MDRQESISKSDGAIKKSRKNTSTQPTAPEYNIILG